ncbi:MAG: thiamine-phosphate kinase [Proteobacteria bacterium]|nr:thiamine-phosphate kinase [Pseudomonadota bacterium]HQR04513.1 thiamine-phosphate kinase [Rhodocyclaceae bacterium]
MPSEFALIERYFKRPAPGAVLGVGDDCALLRPTPGHELAVSTDLLLAGTHFLANTDPADLGWKVLAVNLSDLAAMAATPRWATLALALPQADEPWIAAFSRGFFDCARTFGVELIGGDTTRGPLAFCVTIFGEIPAGQALRRDGARCGDDIWVSGQPGLAALGLAHLLGRVVLPEASREPCLSALHRPHPRIALGLALRDRAHAAIDVSDGLLADLGHILVASGLAARLHWQHLPRAALEATANSDLARECLLGGGDDYELVFTAPPALRDDIATLTPSLGLELSCIGTLTDGNPGHILLEDPQGRPMTPGRYGYDHFA